jgi:hypothetical protein
MVNVLVNDENQVEVKSNSEKWYWPETSLASNDNGLKKINDDLKKIRKKLLPKLNALDLEIKERLVKCVENQEKLANIKKKGGETTNLAFGIGMAGALISLVLSTGFDAIGMPIGYGAYILLEEAQRLQQIEDLMTALIAAFKNEDIEIFPCLEIQAVGSEEISFIDLFVRFPNRRFFMISLQAIGRNTLYHSNKTDLEKQRYGLYLRSTKGRRKDFRPQKLDMMPDQEKCLRQQHRDILGGSSKDSRSGIVKILGLCGKEAKLDSSFPEELTERINGKRFCLAQKNPSIFVMRDKEIIRFIKTKIEKKRF